MAFVSFIFLLFPLLGALVFSNFASTQVKATDVERKNDVNSIYQKLEEHYNEYGWYPTVEELSLYPEDSLPNLDPEALVDPDGNRLQDGGYTYLPEYCSALGCQHYKLTAELADGSPYTKTSLN